MGNRVLPPDEILIEMYERPMSGPEIAEKLGLNANTVMGGLRRIPNLKRRNMKQAARLREDHGRANHAKYWLGKNQPQEMVEKRVAKIRGPNHYLWKGGKARRPYRDKVKKTACVSCGKRTNLGIHHIDFDHYNNDPGNLEVLCVSCHISLHKTEYWAAKREGREPRRSNGPIGWER